MSMNMGFLMSCIAVMTSPAVMAMETCEKTMDLVVGETAAVALSGNPTTGYVWQVAESSDIVEVDVRFEATESPRGMVGSPGRTIVSVTGKTTGQGVVQLVYSRPWEKGKEPAHTCTIKVNVK